MSSLVDRIHLFLNFLLNCFFFAIDILTFPLSDKTKNIQAVQNARRLYNSCVNEEVVENEGVDGLLSVVKNEFGGWPILEGLSWRDSSFNLSNLLFKLREYNHNIIYSCSTSIDDRNSSSYFIRVNKNEEKKRSKFVLNRLDKVI